MATTPGTALVSGTSVVAAVVPASGATVTTPAGGSGMSLPSTVPSTTLGAPATPASVGAASAALAEGNFTIAVRFRYGIHKWVLKITGLGEARCGLALKNVVCGL